MLALLPLRCVADMLLRTTRLGPYYLNEEAIGGIILRPMSVERTMTVRNFLVFTIVLFTTAELTFYGGVLFFGRGTRAEGIYSSTEALRTLTGEAAGFT